jgi:guanylate kinase
MDVSKPGKCPMNSSNPVIVTLTGPSGAGKTYLSHLLKEVGFELLVSTTTRLRRKEETDGTDYHFVSQNDFDQLNEAGRLIEHVEYGGNSYGISAAEAERAFGMGKPAVLVAEPIGVEQIHRYCTDRGWNVVRVFVNNDLDLLLGRLMERFQRDIKGLDATNSGDAKQMVAKIKAYSSRIEAVSDFEQENWVKPAYSGKAAYDIVIDNFDANQQEVLDMVVDRVHVVGGSTAKAKTPRP